MKNDDKEIIELITKGITDNLLKKLLIKSCVAFYDDVVKLSSSSKSVYLKGRNIVIDYLALSTVNDISLRQYCECLKYIQEMNCESIVKSGARKFILFLYKNIIESGINLSNIHTLKQDEVLLTWNVGKTNYKSLIEILEPIESFQDIELKSLIKIYVKNINISENKSLSSGEREQNRLYILALKSILILLRDVKIIDISWKHYCEMMKLIREKRIKDKEFRVGICMRRIICDIYNIILNDKGYENKELSYLRKNREFINWKEVSRDYGDSKFMMDHIITYFPINSKIEDLYLYKGSENNEDSTDYRYVIFNMNTSSKFLKYIISTYIESQEHYKTYVYDKQKILIYYFEMSFGDCVPSKIEDITIDTYRKQYSFYCLLEEKYRNNLEFNKENNMNKKDNDKFLYFLREFYFFILTYIKEKKIEHNIFVGTNITENIFTSTWFNTFDRDGCEFINLTGVDVLVPRFRKWAVIPDGIGSYTNSQNIIRIDFTKLSDEGYIEILQNYYWKGSRNNVRTTVLRENSFVIDFLNYKYKFEQKITPILSNPGLTVNFNGRFLSSYVTHIKIRYSNEETRYSAFKAVKAFLKYLCTVKNDDGKYKYSIDQLGMKALKAKINKNKGGNPIPINILNLILNELEKKRDNSDEAELIYIVIYILINSKLRVGEILNLHRGCIDTKRPGFIKYMSKISYGVFIKDLCTTEVLEMITCAENITIKYVDAADKRFQKYIFISPDRKKKKIIRIKKLSSGVNNEIKRILNELVASGKIAENIKDDILKHSCNDIRATRIDSLYKKGIEEGISPIEISSIAGNSVKVGISNYIQKMKKLNSIEIFAGVKIANVNIKGEILETDEELNMKIKYQDEFGGCNNMKCREKIVKEDYSFSCLVCKQFTTCKSRTDVFKFKINELKSKRDRELENRNQNTIDFINKKIELYTVYLANMLLK